MNDNTWQNNVIFVTFDRKPKKPLSPSNGEAVWPEAWDELEELVDSEGELAEDTDLEWLEPDQGDYDDDEEEDEIL